MTSATVRTGMVHDLIGRWQLDEAEHELEQIAFDLAPEDVDAFRTTLNERRRQEADLLGVQAQLSGSPAQALEQMEKLGPSINNHPLYQPSVSQARAALEAQTRAETLALAREAEAMVEHRQWGQIELILRRIEALCPGWADDASLKQLIQGLKDQLETGQKFDRLLQGLAHAIDIGNWSEARELYNTLETEDVPSKLLAPFKEPLEKLTIRAGGASTTSTDGTEVGRLRQSIVSLEGAKSWRAAVNNIHRLIELLEMPDPALIAQRARFNEALIAEIRQKTQQRVEDAEEALVEGRLTQARRLLEAAQRVGMQPEALPGQPIDVVGTIPPTPEQDAAMNRLSGIIEERDQVREQANALMNEVLAHLRSGTIEHLNQALSTLMRIRGIDNTYPGLAQIEADIRAKSEQALAAYAKMIGVRVQDALRRGDVLVAQEALGQMRASGVKDEQLVTFEAEIASTETRGQKLAHVQGVFEARFEAVQDDLICAEGAELQSLLNQWRELAFDPVGPANASAKLTRFFAECAELSEARAGVVRTLQGSASPQQYVDAAERLAMSSVGNRPATAQLLADFWRLSASQHARSPLELDHLHKAERFAVQSGNAALRESIADTIRAVRSRSEEGRRLSQIEEHLRLFIRERSWNDADDYIRTLDESLRADLGIASLIAEIRRESQREHAKRLLHFARDAYHRGELRAALEQLDELLSLRSLPEAALLRSEINERLQWEASLTDSLNAALRVDVNNAQDGITADDKQVLADGKAAADELANLNGQLISPSVHQLARQVANTYRRWTQQAQASLDELEREVHERINDLEFGGLEDLVAEAERRSQPDDVIARLIDLRSKVRKVHKSVQRVQKRIAAAKELAAMGKFGEASRSLNLNLSDVPQSLKDEASNLAMHWDSVSAQTYIALKQALPKLNELMQQALVPPQGRPDGHPAADRLPSDILPTLTINARKASAELRLNPAEPVRAEYELLLCTAQWLQRAQDIPAKIGSDAHDLEQLREEIRQLVEEGVTLSAKPNAATLSGGIIARQAWLKGRARVVDQFTKTVAALQRASRIRMPFRSAFSERHEELARLGQGAEMVRLTNTEADVREGLLGQIREREHQQLMTFSLLQVPLFLVIGLIGTLIWVLSRPEPPSLPVADASTTPTITTTPPLPTGTATPDPTPTVTPTPAPTPIPPQPAVIVFPGSINVRSQPITSLRALTSISGADNPIQITGYADAPDGIRWYRIDVPGRNLKDVWLLAQARKDPREAKLYDSLYLDGGATLDAALQLDYSEVIR